MEKSVDALLKEKKIFKVINKKLVQAPPEITVKRAIEIMQENKSGYLVIAENKSVKGIFTETDVSRKILGHDVNWDSPVTDYMTKDPRVLKPNDPMGEVIDLMADHRFYHVPLVDDHDELVGVVSVRTLIRFLAEFYPNEVFNLPPDPGQVMSSPEGG